MRVAFATMLLAACSFPTPSQDYACRTTDDCESGRTCTQGYCTVGKVAIDARDIDAGNDCASFSSRHFDACLIPAPDAPLDLTMAGTYTFNTAAGTLTDPAGGAVSPPNRTTANGLVISIQSLHVAAGTTLRVVGTNPLIVAGWSTIQIDGTVDATSLGAPTTLGAGANPTACTGHTGTMGQSGSGAGGGGGGGGQTAGARGGAGGNGNNAGGPGGTLVGTAPLLLGGCAGATGGQGNSQAGPGGDGGGAVQLTARTSLTISTTGKVLAGGAGGKPAQNDGQGGGGGGGGAGGMIGLESPALMVAAGAVLAANGGAGGQGAGNQGTGTAGANGGATATPATNPNNGSGGNGGSGGAGATAPTVGGNDGSGGGGGGGGTGYITIKSASPSVTGATISPAPTMIP